MSSRIITQKTSRLYESFTANSYDMVLIFGDDVKISGTPNNGRYKADFRGRSGYIREDHLGQNPPLEVYFIDVGQGDSTFIVTPGRKKILIDGGVNRRAFGFLAWKYRLHEAETPVDIDLLILSHADGDHMDGLIPIISHPKIRVNKVIDSGIGVFQSGAWATPLGNLSLDGEYLVTRHLNVNDLAGQQLSNNFKAWRDAIVAEGAAYNSVDSTTGTINVGDPDVTLEILGPRLVAVNGQSLLPWFSDKSHTINGHSVVLRLRYDKVYFVFPGDINKKGAEHLLADPVIADKLSAHVLKAPHHGSHGFHRSLLDAVRPQITVISSGDDPDHGHPRAVFVGNVGHASRSTDPLVFSTEIAASFVEADDERRDSEVTNLEDLDFRTTAGNAEARKRFKRRLHGMINVRTDGENLYAARRVAMGYWWESYGPLKPAL